MIRVCLDTSFLITFADPNRKNHLVAVEYYRHCVANGIPMFLSTIAASEFEVKQAVSDLPLTRFTVLPFNIDHARKAGEFRRALMTGIIEKDNTDARAVVAEDLKILAQAEAENINLIFTEDASTLVKFAQRLANAGLSQVRTILMTDGFSPGSLNDPDQPELDLRPE